MKTDYAYPEFQCPYCGIDIEDNGNKLLEKLLFKSKRGRTKFICGNCSNTILLCVNDMEGKLVPYKINKI